MLPPPAPPAPQPLPLSSLLYRWGNEARKELEVAEARPTAPAALPTTPCRIRSWEGGAEPHAIPSPSPTPPQPRRGCSHLADVREIHARAWGGKGGCEAATKRQPLPAAAGGEGAACFGEIFQRIWSEPPGSDTVGEGQGQGEHPGKETTEHPGLPPRRAGTPGPGKLGG